jgi:hypothetical protein
MKKLIFLVIAIGAATYLYLRHQQSVLNPAVIANPVYAEVHMTLDARGRSFEQVLFIQTVNQADCKKYSDATLKQLFDRESSTGDLHWKVKSSECKAELSARYAQLFDNEPTFVTYLSMPRGDPKEREMRLIYWGVSAAESDKVCDGVSQMQSQRKGAVTCIRAAKS